MALDLEFQPLGAEKLAEFASAFATAAEQSIPVQFEVIWRRRGKVAGTLEIPPGRTATWTGVVAGFDEDHRLLVKYVQGQPKGRKERLSFFPDPVVEYHSIVLCAAEAEMPVAGGEGLAVRRLREEDSDGDLEAPPPQLRRREQQSPARSSSVAVSVVSGDTPTLTDTRTLETLHLLPAMERCAESDGVHMRGSQDRFPVCPGFRINRIRERKLDFLDVYCYASAIFVLGLGVREVVDRFRVKADRYYLESVMASVSDEMKRRWNHAVTSLQEFLERIVVVGPPKTVDDWAMPYVACATLVSVAVAAKVVKLQQLQVAERVVEEAEEHFGRGFLDLPGLCIARRNNPPKVESAPQQRQAPVQQSPRYNNDTQRKSQWRSFRGGHSNPGGGGVHREPGHPGKPKL